MTDQNREIMDRNADRYLERHLTPPERLLLKSLKSRWCRIDMLDLGMGAGRTAYTFAAVARSYVGVDYSPRMVALSRANIGESSDVRFLEGDARDLSMFDIASFDVVLFSFNGIDAVDHEDRRRILREVRRVLRPEGVFYFSSHSLSAFGNLGSNSLPFLSGVPLGGHTGLDRPS
jgi:ubiquinone/menaquinone biosynthesis C-methylase UbiE